MTNIDRGGFDQAEYDRRFHGDFMYDATLEDEEGGSPRSPLFIILTGLVLAAFAAVVWVAYQQGIRQGDRGAPPIIAAEAGPIRIPPENPGGTTVPDQDKQIYERIAGADPSVAPAESELAPPPETPQDLPVAATPLAPGQTPEPMIEPGAAEAGDSALAAADLETAQPPPEQLVAEQKAKEQAAALASEIDKIDPGVAAAAKETAVTASGAFVVQIGSYRQDAEAAQNWQALKARNGDLLGALKPDIKRVDLGEKGIYYRLRIGPFVTRADAVAKCEVLRTRNINCIVDKS